MLEPCHRCHRRIVAGGVRHQEQVYCGGYCLRAYYGLEKRDFCQSCLRDTTSPSPGNTGTTNGTGTAFRQNGPACPNCLAIPMRRYYTIFFLPVIPLLKYRVLWVTHDRYSGREFPAQSRLAQVLGRPLL